jgi:NADPH:quinone reductase-like Zn-dependent oxidoreductase
MKAVVRTHYGQPDVLEMKEKDVPTPGDDQVLVRVRAASINKLDWYDLTAPFPARLLGGGIRGPKNEWMGSDLAGQVEAVGKGVRMFKAGDSVFGCGAGSLAEYALAREKNLAQVPPGSSFEECAAVPVAGMTALQALRDKGRVRQGQKVLIDGASGGVGTFAVQIAKVLGADVTAVCSSQNVDSARALGADRVIDYSKEDFTKSGSDYDLVAGVNGYHSILGYRRAVAPGGMFLMVGSHKLFRLLIPTMTLGPILSRVGGKRMTFMGITKINHEDLDSLAALVQSGQVRPVVDRTFALDEAPSAFRYFGEGHSRGKVVVRVGDEPPA